MLVLEASPQAVPAELDMESRWPLFLQSIKFRRVVAKTALDLPLCPWVSSPEPVREIFCICEIPSPVRSVQGYMVTCDLCRSFVALCMAMPWLLS